MWVKPTLVAEVEFAEWTAEGVVRQAPFRGLRLDKPADSVVRGGGKTELFPTPPQLKITHPERVIDASIGVTKADLVRFYASVAGWMLPHLKGRPVALVRAPEGVSGQLFFQKHAERTAMPGLAAHDRTLWPGHPPLLTVDTENALLATAQMNTIEFHTWNSVVSRLDKPDRVILDLDPGEGVNACARGRTARTSLAARTGFAGLTEDKRRKGAARRRSTGTKVELHDRQVVSLNRLYDTWQRRFQNAFRPYRVQQIG